MNVFRDKVLLILSLWEYPFGGGEEYLFQTAIWGSQYKMKCYWLSLTDSKNKPHNELKINDEKYFISIKIPGGFNEETIINWLTLLKPDIVHHQGHNRKDFYNCCEVIRTEFITGVHFWSGVIDLHPEYGNIQIYENYDKHKKNQDFEELIDSKYVTFYSVSDFVTNCVEKICNYRMKYTVYSGSLTSKCLVNNIDIQKNKYVTMVNIHKLKGGEILLKCLKELPEIPIIAVRTEHLSEDLDEKIHNQIQENNKKNKISSFYFERLSDIRYVYSKTKILLVASVVDETFCRTANEAMINGICILTSGRGNLGYVIDNKKYVIDINDSEKWIETISNMYYDNNKIIEANDYFKKRYLKYSEKKCEEDFMNIIKDRLTVSKNNNIMIYCPWCDQGLGIQSRNYYNILKSYNYNVFIFSYKPYNAKVTIDLQKDPSEWLIDNVYYSPHDRESVSDKEIIDFVNKYNIGKCLIPETCWHRVFEIAKLLNNNNVKCFAIPNIEIVRKDEVFKHNYFYKILCNNHLCENIFNSHNIMNTEYIGYSIRNDNIELKSKKLDNNQNNTLKFLFIGGMNAFSRKHIIEICEAFEIASKINGNISLTCTIQKINNLETNDKEKIDRFFQCPNINFIEKHLSYDDIINLYYSHNISIQVSKHEGLGLGFYEALSTGTPIITLDAPPHNEIIIDKINGWIIPCYYKEMTDNTNGLIQSAYFNSKILADKILDISDNREELQFVYENLINHYLKNYTPDIFSEKIINALNC